MFGSLRDHSVRRLVPLWERQISAMPFVEQDDLLDLQQTFFGRDSLVQLAPIPCTAEGIQQTAQSCMPSITNCTLEAPAWPLEQDGHGSYQLLPAAGSGFREAQSGLGLHMQDAELGDNSLDSQGSWPALFPLPRSSPSQMPSSSNGAALQLASSSSHLSAVGSPQQPHTQQAQVQQQQQQESMQDLQQPHAQHRPMHEPKPNSSQGREQQQEQQPAGGGAREKSRVAMVRPKLATASCIQQACPLAFLCCQPAVIAEADRRIADHAIAAQRKYRARLKVRRCCMTLLTDC